ncbi:hypothetical protein GLAREA_09379 [Glarea lozoyensis ATCC 20868]|uniref:Uncharacterized protein n=1 Tax=Glarea lozoyensis (strain ATCC 20868 / MF5171) TaxID=1116229 RepID=S3CT88_GLAL2|nr:uncharacterized protein GLAREA_09379 [Glarea lozoyensis ATCC 20868]EPE28259.1 hypothetical protein GLAREA_09379 [Glarea lozoyensis ATCC 20868]
MASLVYTIHVTVNEYIEKPNMFPRVYLVTLVVCVFQSLNLQLVICDLYTFCRDRRQEACIRDIWEVWQVNDELRLEILEVWHGLMARLVEILQTVEMGSVTNDIQQELRDISERLKTMEKYLKLQILAFNIFIESDHQLFQPSYANDKDQ